MIALPNMLPNVFNKLNRQMVFDNKKSLVLKKILFGAHYFSKRIHGPRKKLA
jgi:hypothetical protein